MQKQTFCTVVLYLEISYNRQFGTDSKRTNKSQCLFPCTDVLSAVILAVYTSVVMKQSAPSIYTHTYTLKNQISYTLRATVKLYII